MIATGPGGHGLRWGHAGESANIRGLVIFAVSLLVVAAAIHLAVWLMMRSFGKDRSRPPAIEATDEAGFAGATHWTNPADDLAKVRALEEARLGGYAWLDASRSRARIPIGRAMELAAAGARPEGAGAGGGGPGPAQGGGQGAGR